MSSENLFEEDFSEELITELEQEYATEIVNTEEEHEEITEEIEPNSVAASAGGEVETNKEGNVIVDYKQFR